MIEFRLTKSFERSPVKVRRSETCRLHCNHEMKYPYYHGFFGAKNLNNCDWLTVKQLTALRLKTTKSQKASPQNEVF